MKRLIDSKFWNDSHVNRLSSDERLLFLYCLTSPYLQLIPYFEAPDTMISGACGFDAERLQKAKAELMSAQRVLFHEGWVFVVNADKHNNYHTSNLTRKKYEDQLARVPQSIISHFHGVLGQGELQYQYRTDTVYESQNNKRIPPKEKEKDKVTGKEKEERTSRDALNDVLFHKELQVLFPGVDIPEEIAKMKDWLDARGRTYKNYRAFARNWLRRAAADVRLRGRQGGRGSVGRV